MLQMEDKVPARLPTEEEEAKILAKRDVEDMAAHRTGHFMRGHRRHKAPKSSLAAGLLTVNLMAANSRIFASAKW